MFKICRQFGFRHYGFVLMATWEKNIFRIRGTRQSYGETLNQNILSRLTN